MTAQVLEQATEERLIRRRASVEEFWSLPESVLPAEYIDGEIIMAPAPTVLHQTVQGNLYYALRTFVQGKGVGRMFGPPLDVVMPTGEVVQPDVFFLNAKQTERVRSAVLRKKHYALTELGEADTLRASVLSGFEMRVGELLGG